MFVVTGATGNTGTVVATTLAKAGKKVRALVRDTKKASALADQGVELHVGDLLDPSAFAKAVQGAEGVYLLSPPDLASTNFYAERKPLLEAWAKAAKEGGVKHVVLLSSVGAQHPTGTGPIRTLHAAEQALRATGVPSTFVRAAYFIENWAAVIPAIKSDGIVPSFLPKDQSIPMVATRDIGATAAQALIDGPKGIRIIELGGPREANATDVAAAATRIIGRPVTVAEAPLEAVVPTFTSFGMSEHAAGLFKEMYEGIRSGHVAWEGGDAEAVRGTTSIEDVLGQLLA